MLIRFSVLTFAFSAASYFLSNLAAHLNPLAITPTSYASFFSHSCGLYISALSRCSTLCAIFSAVQVLAHLITSRQYDLSLDDPFERKNWLVLNNHFDAALVKNADPQDVNIECPPSTSRLCLDPGWTNPISYWHRYKDLSLLSWCLGLCCVVPAAVVGLGAPAITFYTVFTG